MAVKPYRTKLISKELRLEISRLDGGAALTTPDMQPWVIRDLVLSDKAVRYGIASLSGERWADGKPHPMWPELLERIINEPQQIEDKARIIKENADRARAKKAKLRRACDS